MFLLKRPGQNQLEEFLDQSQKLSLSYEPVGIAKDSPSGFNVDEKVGPVGRGSEAFWRARNALVEWRHFDLGWVKVFPERPATEPGTVVAVLINHLGFWSLNGCRVCYEIGKRKESNVFGFAYGTLTNHAELGEEIFEVSIDPVTEVVSYKVRAVSRPSATLARLGYPYTRLLQQHFRRDSLAAVLRAVEHSH